MTKILACISILVVSACASNESARRHPATARAEVDAQHREHHARGDRDLDATERDRLARDHVVVDERTGTAAERVAPVRVADVPAAADSRDDRRETPSDAEITRKIRSAVADDDALTAAAKNVNITTEKGRVTLRGNVGTAREKTTVETYAQQVAGADNVRSQLAVK